MIWQEFDDEFDSFDHNRIDVMLLRPKADAAPAGGGASS
jgi:hypothetical protein